jgi:hypothetical protein
MEVRLSDLARMTRAQRNRTLDEMAKVVTAHREQRPLLSLAPLIHAVRHAFGLRRAER